MNKFSAVRLVNSSVIETIILNDQGIKLREAVKKSFCRTRDGTVLITFHSNGTGQKIRRPAHLCLGCMRKCEVMQQQKNKFRSSDKFEIS